MRYHKAATELTCMQGVLRSCSRRIAFAKGFVPQEIRAFKARYTTHHTQQTKSQRAQMLFWTEACNLLRSRTASSADLTLCLVCCFQSCFSCFMSQSMLGLRTNSRYDHTFISHGLVNCLLALNTHWHVI